MKTIMGFRFGVIFTMMTANLLLGCGDNIVIPERYPGAGYHIAYMEPDGSRFHLGKVDERGVVSTSISRADGSLYNGTHEFSPTGGRIAFFEDEVLKLYDMKTGTITSVDFMYYGFKPNRVYMPSWSPNGERFIVADENKNGFAILDSLGNVKAIRTSPTGLRTAMCLWSPTEDLIAMDTQIDIEILNTSGQILHRFAGSYQLMQWSTDGTKVIVLYPISSTGFQCSSINIADGTIKNLFIMTKPDGYPAYPSQKQNYLVFANNNRIDRYDLETGEKHSTKVNGWVWYAELRNDGKKYVYYSGSSSSVLGGDIHTVNVDGTNDMVIKKGAVLPRWSPTQW